MLVLQAVDIHCTLISAVLRANMGFTCSRVTIENVQP